MTGTADAPAPVPVAAPVPERRAGRAPTGRGKGPHVCILMACWNGARFLPEQLASLLEQTHSDWSLVVRDDGSTDSTPEIVAQFARAHPGHDIRLIRGPGGQGSAPNFLTLLADPDLPDGYIAFADQDDVWMPDKIERGLAGIARARQEARQETGQTGPAAYASRTILTDAALQPRRVSTLHPRPPAFGNALVQNVLGGNTILLDPAAADLLRASCPAALAAGVPFHDWWVYQVITGAGGIAFNDPEPGLFYRQHGANVLGAHRGLSGGRSRFGMIRDRRYAGWIDCNLAALTRVADLLAPDERRRLEGFVTLRRQNGRLGRALGLGRLGIHRQTLAGNLILRALAFAGRL
jgi:glycosyltransferase involved in cell wall biosynthesis